MSLALGRLTYVARALYWGDQTRREHARLALGAAAPQIVVEEALYWLALPNFLVNYWKAGGATLGIRQ